MAKTSSLKFNVGELLRQTGGTRETFRIDVPLSKKQKDFKIASNLKGTVILVKLDRKISAQLSDATIDVIFACSKCLDEIEEEVYVPFAEREFLLDPPKKIEDLADVFLIDKKNLTIDLTEMVRQELILHFPLIPLCSKSCKGLCSSCGKNLNKAKCKCKKPEERAEKPLAGLKKLIKKK